MEKKKKYKKWYKARGSPEEQSLRQEYLESKRVAKKVVAVAKQEERKKFTEKLDTPEGQKYIFRVAKQMVKEQSDVVGVHCLKNENGEIT